MKKFCWVFPALLFLAIAAPRAHADTIFNVSGTAANISGGALGTCASGATCAFSGTLTIDTTAGTLTGVDITFPGLSAFNSIYESFPGGGFWAVVSVNSNTYIMNLVFSTSPTGGSLVGFTGSHSLSASVSYLVTDANIYSGLGTITPATTAVPEPGTLVLLLFGLVALVLVRKRLARGLQPVT